MNTRNILGSLGLVLILVAGVTAQLATSSQVVGNLEQAKQLTSQKKYDDAIARAEAALTQLKQLREAERAAATGTPDLYIVSVTGDGDKGVTVIVQNKGNANVPQTQSGNVLGFRAIKVRLFLVPTGGGQPREIDSTGMMILDGLKPGEAKPVRSRAMGCGLTQRIEARVDPANEIVESNDNNNVADAVEVKTRPCGS